MKPRFSESDRPRCQSGKSKPLGCLPDLAAHLQLIELHAYFLIRLLCREPRPRALSLAP
jgi:hypothetical protein